MAIFFNPSDVAQSIHQTILEIATYLIVLFQFSNADLSKQKYSHILPCFELFNCMKHAFFTTDRIHSQNGEQNREEKNNREIFDTCPVRIN